jgi:primosomal protein N' (replication factor Y) (superfamily II helicase)
MTERPLYASIALPLPLDEFFTYGVPQEFVSGAEIGRRTLVPFGQRLLTGFIVAVSDDPGDVPRDKIKPIQDILDDDPVFDSRMLELAKWAAEYYLSSTGEVLRTAMPSGTMARSRIRAYLEGEPGDSPRTPVQSEVIAHLRAHGPSLLRTIEHALGKSSVAAARALARLGTIRLEREMSQPAARAKTERHVIPVAGASGTLPARARKQTEALAALRLHPEGAPLVEFLERSGVTRGVVNALVEGGFAAYEEVEIARLSKILEQDSLRSDHPLTAAQEECLRLIRAEARENPPRPVLIQGVTGSGKTRVYIELVRDALATGRGAIILVPEIALTPQTARFFTSVFPGRVAVLHSAMSPGERLDMWRLIRDGVRDVVIGPRSAVFAPLGSPGIIIVDEEHDPSYKQADTAPRYHARDVAVVRARLHGIPAVLGSATPSLESRRNAATGKYLLARLPERVESKPLPSVVCADMREDWKAGNQSSLSMALRDMIRDRLSRGEKSIILINRRGFATGVFCRECGHMISCPDCSAGLVYHASKKLALCHICGKSRIVLQHCPECGSDDLSFRGRGTQRVEHELASSFPDAGIVRMDSDTTRAHEAHHRLLEEFRSGSTSILLGTQMVGKGLDIPEVTLVGVISADSTLLIPDFRAAERTFQLITQVAGRAGRGDAPGTVVVQTSRPDHYAVHAACGHDYEAFVEVELASRREVGFPPFSRLILVELSSVDRESLIRRSSETAALLAEHAPADSEVLGPVEAPIARIRGKLRMHILIKTRNTAPFRPVLRELMASFHGPETIAVDVDPVDMM